MTPTKRKSQFTDDKYLISEQPAMMILITGLIAAFFIGFSLKALFNPVRLTEKVAQAAGRVHRDVQISFDSARISLADGIFPDLAVVIDNVRLASEKTCWGQPEIFIDEVRLPLSLVSYFRAGVPVRKVDIHEMVVNIRSPLKKCEGQVSISPRVEINKNDSEMGLADSESELLQQMTEDTQGLKKNPIDRVNIFKLRVNYIPEPRYKAQFESIRLRTKGLSPRQIIIDAKTHLFKDESVGDFLSYANIHMEYSEDPDNKLLVHFFGNLREGYYSFIGNYSFTDHMVNFETEVKHLPLSAILGLVAKVTGEPPKIHPKKLWLSLKAHSSGLIEKLNGSPWILRDVALEGDLLELKTDKLEFSSIQPLDYKPIRLSVKNLSLSELFHIYGKKLPSKNFGHLGVFSGVAEIRQANDISLLGELSNLELNFSNRGDQTVQVIQKMSAELKYLGDNWIGKLNSIELEDGVLSGDVTVQANREFTEVKVGTKIEEILFSESVQKLMTGGGHIKSTKAFLQADILNGKLNALRGYVKNQGILIDDVEVGAFDLQLGTERDGISMNSKLQSLRVPESAEAYGVLSQVVPKSWGASAGLVFGDIRGRFYVGPQGAFEWHNLSGQINKQKKLVLDGGWNPEGLLYGSVLAKDNAGFKKFRVRGTRSAPEIEELK